MANEKRRLIDANELKRAARKWERESFGILRATTVLVGISNAPTVDAVEVVHGRWIEQEDGYGDAYYDCSACGESFCFIEGEPEDNHYRYCPNCGAKMDGERRTDG